LSPELRFQIPKSNRRPYGSHRFDTWSPKIGRRVTLFGQRSLRAWVAIEADPAVIGFCERPLVLESSKPSRVVDFWVRGAKSGEELWILLRSVPDDVTDKIVSPAFREWSQKQGLNLRLFGPDEPALTDEQFRNWGTALRYLAANRKLLKDDLVDAVREACHPGVQLGKLERQLQHYDPILVRTALFHLVHRGTVHATEFAQALIEPSMRFESV
jgi:hypothetical protein